ncbi:DNA-directed RNA polymerase I subunit RPA49 [Aspergillus ruber CBS 135680]|uniref:A49-like RNA polymerase I associated factor-domain-containing protein n=1 Tax=Aspergillus ruber (strain CBS 135680) TaxID=1388766 RepID=A0A017S9E1_ASPRC|nr:uncharacterized protein EURHEDRAFT_504076 [Aspergillus ruber CBS 135680]EYE93436.1 hypothetical protein EURHEDRAFT_504076 [Aspergillus ruber CBS 135680]
MPSDKIDKKRKRHSERHERPSKKPALELQDLPPLSASLVEDNSELAPVIVTTPGVSQPRNINLQPYLKPRANTSSTSSSTRNKGIVSSEILLQSSEHPKLDFVGREANDDADSQLKHYIAVVDPEKKTWQFVEARKVTLRGAVRKMKPLEDEESSEDEEMHTMRAQKTALTHAFGTKQSKKVVQSMAENAQLSNAPAGAVNAAENALLSSMPADSATDIASKTAAVQAQVQAAKPLPQANLAATHPADVYPVEVLVPNGSSTLRQLPGIKEWTETVSSGLAVTTTSRYVSRRVEAVVKSGNTTQIQILRFILLLLEFVRSFRPGGRDAGPGSKRLPPRDDLRRVLSSSTGSISAKNTPQSAPTSTENTLPDPVIDAIRRRFVPQGSHLSKNDITLLHTTVCALSLHIPPQPAKDGGSSAQGGNSANELATDPSDLRDDLRLDNTVITQYFRELGCRVDKPRETEFAKWGIKGGKAEAAARRVARLKVPVEFPKVSRGGRK